MLYTTWHVGDQEYHLRLTTKAIIDLEKKLGRNPVSPFLDVEKGRLVTLTEMTAILHAAMQPLGHGITEAKTCEILDRYFEDGHNLYDLVPVLTDVFRSSGLIPAESGETEENEKN